jgi:hypothetical protein
MREYCSSLMVVYDLESPVDSAEMTRANWRMLAAWATTMVPSSTPSIFLLMKTRVAMVMVV